MKNVKFVFVILMVLALTVSAAVAEYAPSPVLVPIVPVYAVTDDGTELIIIEAETVNEETGLGENNVEQPAIILTTLEDEKKANIDNGHVQQVYDELAESGSVVIFCKNNAIATDLVDFNECNAVFVANFRANELALELGDETAVTLIIENTFGLESGEYHAIRLGDDGVNEVVTIEVTDTEIHIPAKIGHLGDYILLDR